MTIPYKEWTAFHSVTIRGEDAANMFGTAAEWTDDHYETCMIGLSRTGAGVFIRRDPLFKPDKSDFKLVTSLDHIWKVRFDVLFALEINDYIASWIGPYGTISSAIHPEQWDPELVTGKNYDGVNNWSNYPVACWGSWSSITITPADFPKFYEFWLPSYANGALRCYPHQAGFFRNGLHLYIGNIDPGNPANGESFLSHLMPQRVKVYYANAVVNSLSRYQAPIAGGFELIINGLGFDCDDDEIAEDGGYCGAACAAPGVGFNDAVDEIYFIPLQGQTPPAALTSPADFIINSNSKITIASLPAMEAGTYSIMLKKINVGPAAELGIIESYAGDWTCDVDGRTRETTRIVFLIRDENGDDEDPPEIRTKWKWKKGDTEVDDSLAPQDTRGAETFYSGRLKNISPFTRSIDDKTGLFSISDINVTLANPDVKYSKLLASFWLKNQIIEFFYGKGTQPEAWQSEIFKGIAYDYSLKGPHFNVVIKDIIQKYFEIKVPLHVCTKDDYPNIHESAEGGRVRPVVIGEASLIPAVAGENSGAIEAVYVDTVNHSYLAADFSLHSIPQVYSANVLKATPADYTIAYRDGGRTYIDFVLDQGDNKITFNAAGCMVGMWDDPVNGYVQNPAYVISFLLTQLMGMPIDFLVMESFDILAALYTTLGWHQSGFLILQGEARDSWAVLQELLFTFGAKLWPAKDGRIEIGRKDISNFSTDLFFFEQIDLPEPPDRKYNLPEAVNFVNSFWNYAPAHSIFQGAMERKRQASIKDFGKEIMEEWKFPWTTSESMVNQRTLEELMKRSYGDPKVEFSIKMKEFIDDLDIFKNYRLQDPWGLSKTGAGEKGRYYYVESLTYDNQGEKIDVIGIDMQWLLRQYFVLGDENELADNWNIATEEDKMFGYLCDEVTDEFADGDPGKQLCDENLL